MKRSALKSKKNLERKPWRRTRGPGELKRRKEAEAQAKKGERRRYEADRRHAKNAGTRKRKAEYEAIKPYIRERSGDRCEIRRPGICRERRETYHHRRRQSQGGAGDPRTVVACCGPCNSWAEYADGEARAEGVLLSNGEEPDRTPMHTPGRGWWFPA